jgi:hypothetical protein
MITVALTKSEVFMAAHVGMMRRVDSLFKNYNDTVLDRKRHANVSEWAFDIDGACAELAVAKAMGVHWSGHIGSFKEPDVSQIHVRSTSRKDGHLIIRDNDPENYTYMLVITECPNYTIVGGISGKKAKALPKKNADENGSGAWWISQESLHNPELIFNYIKGNFEK